jgi:hypothetical protein
LKSDTAATFERLGTVAHRLKIDKAHLEQQLQRAKAREKELSEVVVKVQREKRMIQAQLHIKQEKRGRQP